MLSRHLMSAIALLLVGAVGLGRQQAEESKPFTEAHLDQLVAPIALHPDSIVSQILMAATCPLEVVQADRWVKDQKTMPEKAALEKALEAEAWDPSVKSLINFPDVLDQMSTKLDWTVKLGDAVLGQEKDVLDAIQRLRTRAKEAGHLETTESQKVVVEEQIIRIEPTKTEIIYVPTYNPTIVYGRWPYPAYPPTYYYPPAYVYPPTAYAFTAGVVMAACWGYAWGGCNWNSGHVDIDINKNINFNGNIDRNKFKGQLGGQSKGNWKHNPKSRKGVPYRDSKTAERFGKAGSSAATKSRDAFRGRATPSTRPSASGGARPTGGASRTPTRPTTRTPTRPNTRKPNAGPVFKGFDSRPKTTRQSTRGRSSRSKSRPSAGRSTGRSRGGRRRG